MQRSDFNIPKELAEYLEKHKVDEETRKKWEEGLKKLREDLEACWPEYCEEMRRARLKSYELSLTRVIG